VEAREDRSNGKLKVGIDIPPPDEVPQGPRSNKRRLRERTNLAILKG
jgi:hypothetical protein